MKTIHFFSWGFDAPLSHTCPLSLSLSLSSPPPQSPRSLRPLCQGLWPAPIHLSFFLSPLWATVEITASAKAPLEPPQRSLFATHKAYYMANLHATLSFSFSPFLFFSFSPFLLFSFSLSLFLFLSIHNRFAELNQKSADLATRLFQLARKNGATPAELRSYLNAIKPEPARDFADTPHGKMSAELYSKLVASLSSWAKKDW